MKSFTIKNKIKTSWIKSRSYKICLRSKISYKWLLSFQMFPITPLWHSPAHNSRLTILWRLTLKFMLSSCRKASAYWSCKQAKVWCMKKMTKKKTPKRTTLNVCRETCCVPPRLCRWGWSGTVWRCWADAHLRRNKEGHIITIVRGVLWQGLQNKAQRDRELKQPVEKARKYLQFMSKGCNEAKADRPFVSCITMEAYLRKVMRRLLVCRLGSRGSSGLFITATQHFKPDVNHVISAV